MSKEQGFTLIELMIVVAIIGILASVALPSYQDYTRRAEMVEALTLSSTFREKVTAYYREKLTFPQDNAQAGMPPADKLISNRVSRMALIDGAIHITMGNKISQPMQGKVLSFRPAVVAGSPASPISWLCGHDVPVTGMNAIGENKTSVGEEYLPISCRAPR